MKPKREITLGEMQTECKLNTDEDGRHCDCCCMEKVCHGIDGYAPAVWDLTDPPRFTEAQMAFLRGCYGIGIFGIMRSGERARTHFFTKFETVGFLDNAEIPLEPGETLDLAELFGDASK